MFLQQLVNGIVVGSVYALFALGLTLVFGVLHVLNLAHGALLMWGAFVGLYVVSNLGLPLGVALVVAMFAGGLLSVVLDILAFRPLRRRSGDDFSAIVSSIGANMILVSFAQYVSHTRIMRLPFGTFPLVIFQFAGLRISLLQLTIIGCMAVAVTGLLLYLHRTSFGRQVRAVAVNSRAAVFLGVNPQWVYIQIFFISGALAAAAGVIVGVAFNSVYFLMGEPILLRAFVVIVLGGMGSIRGSVIAGWLLGIIQAMTVAFLSTELSDAVLFSLLILILLVRPTGLFAGIRRDARVVRQ